MPASPEPSAQARTGLWLLPALALAGCTALAPPPAPAPAPPPPPAVVVTPPPAPPPPDPAALLQAERDLATRELLAFAERLQGLQPIELALERQRLETLLATADPRSQPAAALALALLLGGHSTLGNGANNNNARALALAQTLMHPDAPAAWRPAARVLQRLLAVQRAQDEQIDRQAAQLREQQRRIEQLGAQIEALRAIERSLGNRPASP